MKREARAERRTLAAIFAATLGLVSLLVFFRVWETEIELQAVVSGLRFELPIRQPLTDGLDLAALGAIELSAVELPRARGRPASRLEKGAVRLAAEDGSLTLASLVLPAGTEVGVHRRRSQRATSLALEGDIGPLLVNVHGSVALGPASDRQDGLDVPIPRPLRLHPAAEGIRLELEPAEASAELFQPQLEIFKLSLFTVEGSIEPIRKVSTILSGDLYFESLAGQKLELRRGERLRFESSRGRLRALTPRGDHLELAFHGQVRGLQTGSDATPRDLMPTWLDWLRARHGLALLWGTTLYLFGMINVILRWWRSSS